MENQDKTLPPIARKFRYKRIAVERLFDGDIENALQFALDSKIAESEIIDEQINRLRIALKQNIKM